MTPRGKRRALSDGDRVSAAAETLLRISVLLEAGITPTAAWRHVADAGDGDAEGVADALREGASIPVALASLGGRYTDAGVAWQVATTVGAPLAPSLRAIARSLQDADRTRDDVRAALAEPQRPPASSHSSRSSESVSPSCSASIRSRRWETRSWSSPSWPGPRSRSPRSSGHGVWWSGLSPRAMSQDCSQNSSRWRSVGSLGAPRAGGGLGGRRRRAGYVDPEDARPVNESRRSRCRTVTQLG